nr:hypothetical protein [uncultured Treponema sp.]
MKNKITKELITRYKLTEDDVEIIQTIHKGHVILLKTLGSAAWQAFKIGKLLVVIREKDPASPWGQTVKDLFPFSITTANNYLKVYFKFRDNPEALEGMSKTEAYIESGVKGLIAEKKENIQGRLETATLQEEIDFDIEQIFKMPCVSKAKLENYRIETIGKNGRIWMIDRSGMSMPVAQLYATPPQGFPETEYNELFRNVQIALELYFEKIEKYEKMGISTPVYNE